MGNKLSWVNAAFLRVSGGSIDCNSVYAPNDSGLNNRAFLFFLNIHNTVQVVACEFSGIVREDAVSCNLLPSDKRDLTSTVGHSSNVAG
jgi:hypothetical protein